MKKHVFILVFIAICLVNYCDAQDISHSVHAGRIAHGSIGTGKGKGMGKPPKKPGTARATVTITADEVCSVKIGHMNYGTLNKGEIKTISLAYGTYPLVATNATTHDEYRAELNVRGAAHTVRIDLNAARVAREHRTDSLKRTDKFGRLEVRDTARLDSTSSKRVISASHPNANVKTNEAGIVKLLLSNMVAIHGGSFVMGNDLGYNDEGPAHAVTIRNVQFSKYEVTQEQWETIMGTNPSINKGCKDCPVENINWREVDSFLLKLNSIGSGTFRLPTEAEWEYVARKGGDFNNVQQKAWYEANSGKKTHPVGTRLPDAMGIHDLLGNVAEWCSDWYALNYYRKRPMNNPGGPASGKQKVVRGGSYNNSAGTLRPSYRDRQNPGSKAGTTGLRLVMDVQ